MKPRLVILSDLWGTEKSEWINNYTKILDPTFEIQYYDCCKLGTVNKTIYRETNLHNQFINGGIEIAIKKLLDLEKNQINILAFSVGGSIAWGAILKGLKVVNFTSVSSTRLRHENKKINCTINLYYGEQDNYKPTAGWFNKFDLKPKILKNKNHELYTESTCVKEICETVKTLYK